MRGRWLLLLLLQLLLVDFPFLGSAVLKPNFNLEMEDGEKQRVMNEPMEGVRNWSSAPAAVSPSPAKEGPSRTPGPPDLLPDFHPRARDSPALEPFPSPVQPQERRAFLPPSLPHFVPKQPLSTALLEKFRVSEPRKTETFPQTETRKTEPFPQQAREDQHGYSSKCQPLASQN